jgi:SNF2 family DNA or RNA helicase
MIAPLYIARKKSDAGIQLPDREIKDVLVPINYSEYPQQRTIIDQIRKFSQIVLDSGQKLNIMEQLAQLTRQRQANVFPGGIEVTDTDPATGETRILFTTAHDIDEAAKMDSVSEHIEAHRGQRQVVFSQFTTALAEFEQRLKREGHRVIRLDGSTSKTMRSAIKTNFYKAKGEAAKWDIVLVNYKTGGAGLNLTSCTVTHVLDSEWNPGNEEQALHRTYRIGQDEETLVYRYLVPASVDTRIEAIKRRKRAIVEAFESGEIKSLKFDKGAEVAEALAAI